MMNEIRVGICCGMLCIVCIEREGRRGEGGDAYHERSSHPRHLTKRKKKLKIINI